MAERNLGKELLADAELVAKIYKVMQSANEKDALALTTLALQHFAYNLVEQEYDKDVPF
jgi:hypothetical protein